ncbi:MAG: anhydro-N-acetylmuramic acid kinase [Gammaproteobacteria bacterium]|nr:anhydro-N-acetylmuramic acid kinase [Gammaproteobacteria bacterium]
MAFAWLTHQHDHQRPGKLHPDSGAESVAVPGKKNP